MKKFLILIIILNLFQIIYFSRVHIAKNHAMNLWPKFDKSISLAETIQKLNNESAKIKAYDILLSESRTNIDLTKKTFQLADNGAMIAIFIAITNLTMLLILLRRLQKVLVSK